MVCTMLELVAGWPFGRFYLSRPNVVDATSSSYTDLEVLEKMRRIDPEYSYYDDITKILNVNIVQLA